MEKGLLITIEGVEGAGKTTQTSLLADWLAGLGFAVVRTREPGAGQICAQIRALLLNPQNAGLAPMTEALLMAADRAQHIAEVIRPAMAEGKIVLCDRYIDSHIAYQGYGRGLDIGWLQELNRQATGGLWPDMTLLLDLPVAEGLHRAADRGEADRMEQEQLAFHQRLAEGFLAICRADRQRVRLINAAQTPEQVQAEIRAQVGELLRRKGLVQADAL